MALEPGVVGPGARRVDGNALAVGANPRDWSGGGLDRQHRSGRDQRARTVAFLPPQAGRHDCGRGVAVGLDGRSSW